MGLPAVWVMGLPAVWVIGLPALKVSGALPVVPPGRAFTILEPQTGQVRDAHGIPIGCVTSVLHMGHRHCVERAVCDVPVLA